MPLDFEQQFYSDKVKLIVGCDEAGRGCLLGPVYAGAVILPQDFSHELINDSKKLTEKQREEAYKVIIENAVAWGVGFCSPEEIDEINILNASRLAMERAIENMNHNYDLIITDCMKMPKAKVEVIDLVHLLLGYLKENYPDSLKNRFNIEQIGTDGEVLNAICEVRKIVNSNGENDTVRAEAVLLKEFKEGKLGRITLEKL